MQTHTMLRYRIAAPFTARPVSTPASTSATRSQIVNILLVCRKRLKLTSSASLKTQTCAQFTPNACVFCQALVMCFPPTGCPSDITDHDHAERPAVSSSHPWRTHLSQQHSKYFTAVASIPFNRCVSDSRRDNFLPDTLQGLKCLIQTSMSFESQKSQKYSDEKRQTASTRAEIH